MFITIDQFKQCFPHCKSPTEWYNALQEVLPLNNINTKNREICFLAQCGHESGEFNILRENFNYSADGLLKIFPKYFTAETAKQYARQPEKIANKVYANRMGNGDEASGDGFKYRGIGLIQLTGKDNITRCSIDIFKDDRLVNNPEILSDPIYSIIAACWFWNKNNLNILADKLDMTALTKKINGGTIGLQERINLLSKIKSIVK